MECKFRPVFFFNDTATTEIYTLSLHDALPISRRRPHRDHGRLPRLLELRPGPGVEPGVRGVTVGLQRQDIDRKSTRLNSSHANISYAVFCLKKKNIMHLLSP